jgi:hypothetical protein
VHVGARGAYGTGGIGGNRFVAVVVIEIDVRDFRGVEVDIDVG